MSVVLAVKLKQNRKLKVKIANIQKTKQLKC